MSFQFLFSFHVCKWDFCSHSGLFFCLHLHVFLCWCWLCSSGRGSNEQTVLMSYWLMPPLCASVSVMKRGIVQRCDTAPLLPFTVVLSLPLSLLAFIFPACSVTHGGEGWPCDVLIPRDFLLGMLCSLYPSLSEERLPIIVLYPAAHLFFPEDLLLANSDVYHGSTWGLDGVLDHCLSHTHYYKHIGIYVQW